MNIAQKSILAKILAGLKPLLHVTEKEYKTPEPTTA
jgi:hypothetical protein